MGVEMAGSAAIRSAVRLLLSYDDGETGLSRSPDARPGAVRCRGGPGLRTGAPGAGHPAPVIASAGGLGRGAAAPERADGGVPARAHRLHGLAQVDWPRGARFRSRSGLLARTRLGSAR